MSKVERSPAISRRQHPAEDLPERPARQSQPAASVPQARPTVNDTPQPAAAPHVAAPSVAAASSVAAPKPSASSSGAEEGLTEQHNMRIRPSVKVRATHAVAKWRYETGDRTISLQSITDAALDEYLAKRGC